MARTIFSILSELPNTFLSDSSILCLAVHLGLKIYMVERERNVGEFLRAFGGLSLQIQERGNSALQVETSLDTVG